MDEKKFLFLISRLVSAFPNEPWNDERFKLYYEFLGDEDPVKLAEVINYVISESQWFPKIADLKDRIHPTKSKDEEYVSYLDRKNLEFAETMRPAQIEYFSKEEAKEFLGKITNHIEEAEQKELQDRERRFQERKKFLEEQKKIVLKMN